MDNEQTKEFYHNQRLQAEQSANAGNAGGMLSTIYDKLGTQGVEHLGNKPANAETALLRGAYGPPTKPGPGSMVARQDMSGAPMNKQIGDVAGTAAMTVAGGETLGASRMAASGMGEGLLGMVSKLTGPITDRIGQIASHLGMAPEAVGKTLVKTLKGKADEVAKAVKQVEQEIAGKGAQEDPLAVSKAVNKYTGKKPQPKQPGDYIETHAQRAAAKAAKPAEKPVTQTEKPLKSEQKAPEKTSISEQKSAKASAKPAKEVKPGSRQDQRAKYMADPKVKAKAEEFRTANKRNPSLKELKEMSGRKPTGAIKAKIKAKKDAPAAKADAATAKNTPQKAKNLTEHAPAKDAVTKAQPEGSAPKPGVQSKGNSRYASMKNRNDYSTGDRKIGYTGLFKSGWKPSDAQLAQDPVLRDAYNDWKK